MLQKVFFPGGCACACAASVSHVLVLGHCTLQRQLIRNSRWASLTIPGKYRKRDRRRWEEIMKIENKRMTEWKWQRYADITARWEWDKFLSLQAPRSDFYCSFWSEALYGIISQNNLASCAHTHTHKHMDRLRLQANNHIHRYIHKYRCRTGRHDKTDPCDLDPITMTQHATFLMDSEETEI